VTVSKRYDQAGSYVITLTVTDDAGQQGTVSQTISVVP
jgi:PKD repeat protein